MRGKNLMHWYWRAAIAVVAGGAAWVFFHERWVRFLSGRCPVDDWADAIVGKPYSDPLLGAILPVLVCLAVYGLLLFTFGQNRPSNGEPRCRKCGYNLTGNVSGVCPECGERI
jgi:hypothetical protein